MSLKKLLSIFIFLFLLINNTLEKDKIMYKCGKNDLKIKPQALKSSILLDHNNTVYKRRLDSNGFKEFNIYFYMSQTCDWMSLVILILKKKLKNII